MGKDLISTAIHLKLLRRMLNGLNWSLKEISQVLIYHYILDDASYSSWIECEGILYIFGGISQVDPNNNLYKINLESLECEKVEQKGFWPLAINSHTAVLNPDTKKMYIYGGLIKYKTSPFLFEYDITTSEWRKVETTTPSPVPRSSHSAVFYQGSMIIFGGISSEDDVLNDMWELNLTDFSWKRYEHEEGATWPTVLLFNCSLDLEILW